MIVQFMTPINNVIGLELNNPFHKWTQVPSPQSTIIEFNNKHWWEVLMCLTKKYLHFTWKWILGHLSLRLLCCALKISDRLDFFDIFGNLEREVLPEVEESAISPGLPLAGEQLTQKSLNVFNESVTILESTGSKRLGWWFNNQQLRKGTIRTLGYPASKPIRSGKIR